MNTTVKSDLKSKTFYESRSYCSRLKEKESITFDYKFYQKLFVILISMSTILTFPDSPIELENICKSYNSIKLCSVW